MLAAIVRALVICNIGHTVVSWPVYYTGQVPLSCEPTQISENLTTTQAAYTRCVDTVLTCVSVLQAIEVTQSVQKQQHAETLANLKR